MRATCRSPASTNSRVPSASRTCSTNGSTTTRTITGRCRPTYRRTCGRRWATASASRSRTESRAPIMTTARVVLERGVAVPMRDGVVLAADVYRPDDTERHPVLLMRTPYDATMPGNAFSALDGPTMAARGYVVVIQDVRGRFASEGDFESYVFEAEDGYDTVQWPPGQTCPAANVAMFATSYISPCHL